MSSICVHPTSSTSTDVYAYAYPRCDDCNHLILSRMTAEHAQVPFCSTCWVKYIHLSIRKW